MIICCIEEHAFEGQRAEELAKTNAMIKERNAALPQTEKAFLTDQLDMKLG
jgi:hypothetical protein